MIVLNSILNPEVTEPCEECVTTCRTVSPAKIRIY